MPSNTFNRRGFIEHLALAAAANAFPSVVHSQGQVKPMTSDNLTGKAKIRIRKPPSDVFTAFADAKAMSAFWFTRRDDGLKKGEKISWFMGSGKNAFSFDMRVKEVKRPERIEIEWENGGDHTQVVWTIDGTAEGDTLLTIEESGFTGSRQSILERALDSTAGFNQVIVAAKAYVEYGIAMNVVADHG